MLAWLQNRTQPPKVSRYFTGGRGIWRLLLVCHERVPERGGGVWGRD